MGWVSIVGIAICHGMAGEARLPAPIQTCPRAQAALCTVGTKSLSLGLMWPGHGVNHPPPSRANTKERVELYHYSPYRISCLVLG